MKTILYFLNVLFLFLFFSCVKNDISFQKSDNKLKLSPSEIGKYHNVLIDLYRKKSNIKFDNKLTIKKIQDEFIFLMKDNYSELMEDFIIPEKGNYLNDKYIKISDRIVFIDINLILSDAIGDLESEGKIEKKNLDIIKNILTSKKNSFDNYTYSDITNFLFLINKEEFNDYEKELLNVFYEVLKSSNEYWTNNYKNKNLEVQAMSKGSYVTLADAAGSILGLYGGPVWSIIQGAVASVIVNESSQINFNDVPVEKAN